MSGSPEILTQRRLSKMQVLSLNDRFKSYIEKVNSMRDQCKKIENNVFLTQVSTLQNEIYELKFIYERELENQRDQLDSVTSERNSFHLEANRTGSQLKEFQEKYNSESNNRKKLEAALADSHRLLAEKDSLIQELRITIAQHQNQNLDLRKEFDENRDQLSTLQIKYDKAAALSSNLEADLQKLSSQISFERELQKTEVNELKNKVASTKRALEIAEQKLSDHDFLDEKLHNKVENIRRQTQQEFMAFQEQSENNYQLQLQEYKNHLDQERDSLALLKEENFKLKSTIEEMNLKIFKLDRKCISAYDQNKGLRHILEIERNSAVATINELEEKLQQMKESLDTKIRELNLANSSNIPIDLEIAALSRLLEAEESRLKVALSNPPGELVLSSRGELIPSKNQSARRSLPGSPRTNGALPSLNPSLIRTKSTPAITSDTTSANQPQRSSPSQLKYTFLPPLTDTNRGINHPPRTFGNTAIPLIYKPKN